jgi:FdhD protein
VATKTAANDDHGKEDGGPLLFAGGGRGRGGRKTPGNLDKIDMLLPPRDIFLWMEKLVDRSVLHNVSHGTHCSALADAGGIIFSREDIGRHNTIDMIGGRMLLNDWSGADKILLTTGRISSEMAQKAWALGIPVIVTRSAPTAEALDIMEEAGITLVGYVRNGRMNVYTHEKRVNMR